MSIKCPGGDPPRMAVATDVPVWRTRTGAARRMESLWRHLASLGIPLRIFYLGDWSGRDRSDALAAGWDVTPACSDEPPRERMARLRWQWDATRHWLQSKQPGAKEPSPADTRKLGETRWWWAAQQFAEWIREEPPDFVLIEYVTLAYLLDALRGTERQRLVCLLDSHDLLHERARQFAAAGHPHWLDITAREEADAVSRFDWVLAIQNREAEAFQKLAPGTRVARVGHAVDSILPEPLPRTPAGAAPVVGYLGSRNASNEAAVDWFLRKVWPGVRTEVPEVRFRVAGDVGDAWTGSQRSEFEGVEWPGRVESVGDFLAEVDVVVNPVTFGTGLKIKNAETLAWGRPLVTTPEGWEGLDIPTGMGVQIAETADDMVSAVVLLLRDESLWAKASGEALQLAEREFSVERAYSELNSILFGI